jgi:Alr-MurF fusion protein
MEAKVAEKLQLFRAAENLFLCRPSLRWPMQQNYCQSMEINPVSWSSEGNNAHYRLSYSKKKRKTSIEANWNDQMAAFTIPFTDASAIENACHCFAVQ